MKYAEDDFGQTCVPDRRLGVIVFLRMAALDQHSLVKNVSKDDWLPAFCYLNEWCFQWCDYLTRTSGRLTKFIRVVDAVGCGISWFNVEANRRDGHAMNAMEGKYSYSRKCSKMSLSFIVVHLGMQQKLEN